MDGQRELEAVAVQPPKQTGGSWEFTTIHDFLVQNSTVHDKAAICEQILYLIRKCSGKIFSANFCYRLANVAQNVCFAG